MAGLRKMDSSKTMIQEEAELILFSLSFLGRA